STLLILLYPFSSYPPRRPTKRQRFNFLYSTFILDIIIIIFSHVIIIMTAIPSSQFNLFLIINNKNSHPRLVPFKGQPLCTKTVVTFTQVNFIERGPTQPHFDSTRLDHHTERSSFA